MPKRPEIKPADFAKALEDQPLAVIPFEPQMFGTAANNGQMIAEVSTRPQDRGDVPPAGAGADRPRRGETPRGGLLTPLLAKLMKKQASAREFGA